MQVEVLGGRPIMEWDKGILGVIHYVGGKAYIAASSTSHSEASLEVFDYLDERGIRGPGGGMDILTKKSGKPVFIVGFDGPDKVLNVSIPYGDDADRVKAKAALMAAGVPETGIRFNAQGSRGI